MLTKATNLKRICVWLFFLAGFFGHANAWWNSEWTIRRKFTIDTTPTGGNITDPIGSSAVLLRLHDGNFQFASAKDDGSDIRIVAEDDKTLLSYHIERFDALMNEGFVWVKIPDIKPAAKVSFWLYYGNNSPKAASVNDPKGTYDADTALVYHFAERGAPPVDSTSNGNNAQNTGVKIEGSLIAGGLRLTGQTPITIPSSGSLDWNESGTVTWSAWIKFGAPQANAIILSRRNGNKSVLVGSDNNVPFIEVNGQRTAANAPIAANSWHHLAFVASGTNVTLYVDGASSGSLATSLPALTVPILLGGDSAEGAIGFSGEIDEMQISRVARPVGFIQFAAFSQQGGDRASKLLVAGEEEQKTSWFSGGYFGIIIKSLTADGWVVIGILSVMSAFSWFVMITKVSYLNALTKANDLFLTHWQQVATDLTVLDNENAKTLGGRVDEKTKQAMKHASLFRIYHIGVEEIRHRLSSDKSRGVERGLSGRSIQAIRASLDGGLIRETQKLNKLIVFLTLSISGGPFLGLLGTVIGVMITFAAVAAAGDVNVNAIAPGIAAALLATVAGLAVAIPALFGYNYILSRVKEATSDMHVFIDEFVTKAAEFYRES